MIKQTKNQLTLRFRRWSRKSYAVFQSLGKVVTIGSLRKSAIEMSAVKEGTASSANICISSNEHNEKDNYDDGIPHDLDALSLIERIEAILLLIAAKKAIYAHAYGVNTANNYVTAYRKRAVDISYIGGPLS